MLQPYVINSQYFLSAILKNFRSSVTVNSRSLYLLMNIANCNAYLSHHRRFVLA